VGRILTLPASSIQLIGQMPLGGTFTVENLSESGSVWVLERTTGNRPTDAQVLASHTISPGGSYDFTCYDPAWYWAGGTSAVRISTEAVHRPLIEAVKPERMVFVSSGSVDVTVELWDSDYQRCYLGVITILDDPGSLPYWIDDAGVTWPVDAVGGRILGISGGLLYWQALGDGDLLGPFGHQGVVQDLPAPDATNMEPAYVGQTFGLGSGLGSSGASSGSKAGFSVLSIASEVKAVSNTVLRAFGATNWTGATANGGKDRMQTFTNLSTSLDAYIDRVAVGASLTGTVSSTSFLAIVPKGEPSPVSLVVPAGYDTAIVRGSSSSDSVRGEEWLR